MLGILKLIRIIKSQSSKTKFLLLTLPFLVCFAAVLISWVTKYSFPLKHDAATLYLIDYNFYYGTRIFIGSIYTALMKHISDNFIFAVNLIAYIVCVLLFLRCLMIYFRKAAETCNITLAALIPCFLMCPYSILQFSGWVGSYDTWLCIAMIVSCFAAGNKAARWFIPIISVYAVFTHYAFVFSFFPAIACVQLFMPAHFRSDICRGCLVRILRSVNSEDERKRAVSVYERASGRTGNQLALHNQLLF